MKKRFIAGCIIVIALVGGSYLYLKLTAPLVYTKVGEVIDTIAKAESWPLMLDTDEYNERLLDLASYEPPIPATTTPTSTPVSNLVYGTDTNVTVEGEKWPAEAVYPHGGALLPFNRIVAYYGNFYSPNMGILGEFATSTVLAHLDETVAEWNAADPTTPVTPAIHYIAMVAQAGAGADGMYRAVMPDEEIEKAHQLAQDAEGVLFIDLQVGLSNLESELPQFEKFLKRPDVHLGIDPEFSMHGGQRPGTVIGSYSADDINYAIDWLADIVRTYELPPKMLVIHRFTQAMVQNAEDITPQPEVQVVMNMDGWGSKQLKHNTYRRVIIPEPVQFTGIKIFYKNDLKPPSTGLLTPEEVLDLYPKPAYIQYQ